MSNSIYSEEDISRFKECIDSLILPKMGFHRDCGHVVEHTHPMLNDGYRFTFKKETVEITIEIEIRKTQKGFETLSITICHGTEHLNLLEWAIRQRKLDRQRGFRTEYIKGDPYQKLNALIHQANRILNNTSIQDVLKGDSWIHIPFDWTSIGK